MDLIIFLLYTAIFGTYLSLILHRVYGERQEKKRRARLFAILDLMATLDWQTPNQIAVRAWADSKIPVARVEALIRAGISPTQARTPQVRAYTVVELEALAALQKQAGSRSTPKSSLDAFRRA